VTARPQGAPLTRRFAVRVAARPLVLGLAVLTLVSAHEAWEATAKSVALTVDGQRQVVRTHGDTVADVLEAAHVSVGDHDLLAPAEDVEITSETSVVLRHGRLMTLTVDGVQREVWVTAMSVAEALDQIGLGHADAVLSADRSRAIPLKGFSLDVRTRKDVQLLDGGKVRRVVSNGVQVADLLREQKVVLRPTDRLTPAATTPLRDGTVVRVTRVSGRTSVENDPIAYSVVRRADSSLYRGQTRLVRAGRVGVVKRTYALTIVNGKVAKKKLVSSVRTAAPVAKIVRYGTKRRPYSVEGADSLNWRALARCESGGNPRATGGNGRYRGLYQFTLSTWHAVGGQGDPIDWGWDEQTYRAKLLYVRRGDSPWPTCGRLLYT
jgi:resuscitation-promoting factor RpfB